MTAVARSRPETPDTPIGPRWADIHAAAPDLAMTMQAYLSVLGGELSARSVRAAEVTLRQFAEHIIATDPRCRSVADITAEHVANFRAELHRPNPSSQRWPVSAGTVEYRVATLRRFFGHIAAWGFADSPSATPTGGGRRGPQPPRRRPGGGRPPKPVPTPPKSRPALSAAATWTEIARRAPHMAGTMTAYVEQLTVSHRPASVRSASQALRLFARYLTTSDPACRSVADIHRGHIEAYKIALANRAGRKAPTLSASTIRHNLGQLRTFFERLVDWDHPDKPARVPIYAGDLPKADDPLPKFLDDPTAAKFMAALAIEVNRRRRLIVELLARTGMRVGELAALEDDAVYRVKDTYWLRIPVGKLHNDRNVPLHPLLVGLIGDYRSWRGASSTGLLLGRNDGQPLDRYVIARAVDTVARRAGIGHVHPHQLRHTLATQCLNRGMSLEAIAALLGHRSPRMTLVYARISDTNVADQYFRATLAVEADTATPDAPRGPTPPRRLLANGYCTRPVELDCRFQTICEGCGFYQTGVEFVDILRRQRDNATVRADAARAKIYHDLINVIDAS
jgi:integrase